MDWIKQSHIYMNETMKHVKLNIYPTNLLLLSVRMVGWSTWSVGRDAGPVMLVSSLRYNLGSKLQKLRQRWAREMTCARYK